MLDVNESIELQFEDGRFVVPKWWGRLPSFRGVGIVDGVRLIPFNYSEARSIVNKDLDGIAVSETLRSWRTRKPKEENLW
jgi:hypothetical protein